MSNSEIISSLSIYLDVISKMAEWTKKFNFAFEMKMSTLGENEENILTKNGPTLTNDDTKITFEKCNKYYCCLLTTGLIVNQP